MFHGAWWSHTPGWWWRILSLFRWCLVVWWSHIFQGHLWRVFQVFEGVKLEWKTYHRKVKNRNVFSTEKRGGLQQCKPLAQYCQNVCVFGNWYVFFQLSSAESMTLGRFTYWAIDTPRDFDVPGVWRCSTVPPFHVPGHFAAIVFTVKFGKNGKMFQCHDRILEFLLELQIKTLEFCRVYFLLISLPTTEEKEGNINRYCWWKKSCTTWDV